MLLRVAAVLPGRHPRVYSRVVSERCMAISGVAVTRLPFETPAHTDELFESNARREAEARLQHLIELKGIGLLTERAHEVSGTSKRGRFRQNYRVPTRRRRPASRPVSGGLRLPAAAA